MTQIDPSLLKSLTDITEDNICHTVYESLLSRESVSEIDIGYGKLYIMLENERIKYKFIPSEKLEERVHTTVKTKTSPVATKLEKNLKKKIESVYSMFTNG